MRYLLVLTLMIMLSLTGCEDKIGSQSQGSGSLSTEEVDGHEYIVTYSHDQSTARLSLSKGWMRDVTHFEHNPSCPCGWGSK